MSERLTTRQLLIEFQRLANENNHAVIAGAIDNMQPNSPTLVLRCGMWDVAHIVQVLFGQVLAEPNTDRHKVIDLLFSRVREYRNSVLGIGALNTFPKGKCRDDDEGALTYSCGIVTRPDGTPVLKLTFYEPVEWIGLAASDARELAQYLLTKADEMDAKGASL